VEHAYLIAFGLSVFADLTSAGIIQLKTDNQENEEGIIMEPEKHSIDKATQEMLQHMHQAGMENAWTRFKEQEPQCGFGKMGLCCRNCSMGPCRIDPFGEGPELGICGATADTIAARNLLRMVAAGAAAHSDHGRDIAHTFKMVIESEQCDYMIKDERKLKQFARRCGIKTDNRETKEIAAELSDIVMNEFGRQEGTLKTVAAYAPGARQKVWQQLGLTPRSIDREIVEIMHRTHMGVGSDYKNLMKQAIRCSLSDGWGRFTYCNRTLGYLVWQPETDSFRCKSWCA